MSGAASKSCSHRSDVNAGHSEPNSIFSFRIESAYLPNISGNYFGDQPEMSWQELGLCCSAANPSSVQGTDGWA